MTRFTRHRVRKRRPDIAGFTLIELLVVMAIVALLLSIAVPRYFGSLAKSKDIALRENLKVLRVTLDRFYADKGRYPEALEDLVEQKYLRGVPVDPVTESARTWILVAAPDGERQGIVDVKSGAPGASTDGQPYASF
jgi:general secretion pathway protein G